MTAHMNVTTTVSAEVTTHFAAEKEGQDIPDEFLLFAQLYMLTVWVVTVMGNLLTIIVICSWTKLRTVGNAFIVHLSITDMMYMTFSFPFRFATFHQREWLWGETFCCIFGAVNHCFYGLSVMTLAAIATNRLVHVVYPGHYRAIYNKRGLVLIFSGIYTLIFVVVFLLPVAGIWGDYAYNPSILSCTFSHDKDPAHMYFVLCLGVWVPCVFIIICYVHIFVHVRGHHKRMEAWSKRGSVETPSGQPGTTSGSAPISTLYQEEVQFEPQLRSNQVSPLSVSDKLEVIIHEDRSGNLTRQNGDGEKGEMDNRRVSTVSTGAIYVTNQHWLSTNHKPSAVDQCNNTDVACATNEGRSSVGSLSNEATDVSRAPVSILKKPSGQETVQTANTPQKDDNDKDIATRKRSEPVLELIQEVSESDTTAHACGSLPSNHRAACRTISTESDDSGQTDRRDSTVTRRKASTTSQLSSHSKKSVTFLPVATTFTPTDGDLTQCSTATSDQLRAAVESSLPISADRDPDFQQNSMVQRNRLQALRLTAMMLVTFVLYLLCTVPYFIVHVSTIESRFPMAYLCSLIVSWLSSCLNPVVYAVMNLQFRCAYRSLLQRTVCCRGRWRKQSEAAMIADANSLSLSVQSEGNP